MAEIFSSSLLEKELSSFNLTDVDFLTAEDEQNQIIQDRADNRMVSVFETINNQRVFYADIILSEMDMSYINGLLIGLNNNESKIDWQTRSKLSEEIQLVAKQILVEAKEVLFLPTNAKNQDCFKIIQDSIDRYHQLLFSSDMLTEKSQIIGDQDIKEDNQDQDKNKDDKSKSRVRFNLKSSNWFNSN